MSYLQHNRMSSSQNCNHVTKSNFTHRFQTAECKTTVSRTVHINPKTNGIFTHNFQRLFDNWTVPEKTSAVVETSPKNVSKHCGCWLIWTVNVSFQLMRLFNKKVSCFEDAVRTITLTSIHISSPCWFPLWTTIFSFCLHKRQTTKQHNWPA